METFFVVVTVLVFGTFLLSYLLPLIGQLLVLLFQVALFLGFVCGAIVLARYLFREFEKDAKERAEKNEQAALKRQQKAELETLHGQLVSTYNELGRREKLACMGMRELPSALREGS